jgi:hypothetical protein
MALSLGLKEEQRKIKGTGCRSNFIKSIAIVRQLTIGVNLREKWIIIVVN